MELDVLRLDRLRADIELIGGAVKRAELDQKVRAERPDVVLLALEDHEIPDLCMKLQRSFPSLGIVGLGFHGRSAALFLNEVGLEDLVDMIRLGMRHGSRGSR